MLKFRDADPNHGAWAFEECQSVGPVETRIASRSLVSRDVSRYFRNVGNRYFDGEHIMSLDAYRGLVSEFGGAIGLTGLAPDEEGYCALTFDDVPVHLQYEPEKDEIVAFSRLGTAN